MDLDIDVGVVLDVRHDGAESSKFIFSFEVDIDAMEEAGLGWATMFSEYPSIPDAHDDHQVSVLCD